MNLAIKSPSYCLVDVRVQPHYLYLVDTVMPGCLQNNSLNYLLIQLKTLVDAIM